MGRQEKRQAGYEKSRETRYSGRRLAQGIYPRLPQRKNDCDGNQGNEPEVAARTKGNGCANQEQRYYRAIWRSTPAKLKSGPNHHAQRDPGWKEIEIRRTQFADNFINPSLLRVFPNRDIQSPMVRSHQRGAEADSDKSPSPQV